MKLKKVVSVVGLIIIVLLLICSICAGCAKGINGSCNYEGYDSFDNDYHFDRAIIRMPDGNVIEIKIEKWSDAEDGEQLTITSTDGKRYLVNSCNCVLIEDEAF